MSGTSSGDNWSAGDVPVGQVGQGYVTYVGSKGPWIGAQFMSFSYSANGKRFHKSLNETIDAWSTATLHKVSHGLKLGDPVQVCEVSEDFSILPHTKTSA
jgi:hypothetical protein